jgi:signal transduction histidine kinase
MSELIDSILRYSEIGRTNRQMEKINLNELVEETIAQIGPPEKIQITIENDLPMVFAEKTHLKQVFLNLINNGIKYMDKPQGQIRIICVEEDKFWKFSVADNGPGIAERYFDKIFEMFQTLSSRDEIESTGIGLAIVKKIIELYGGGVWLESKVGEGSTFFFTLPKSEMQVEDYTLETSIGRR